MHFVLQVKMRKCLRNRDFLEKSDADDLYITIYVLVAIVKKQLNLDRPLSEILAIQICVFTALREVP